MDTVIIRFIFGMSLLWYREFWSIVPYERNYWSFFVGDLYLLYCVTALFLMSAPLSITYARYYRTNLYHSI
jgi:hypothetical protein